MALDFKLLHYQPAAIPCDPSLNGRPGIGISQTFVQIGGEKAKGLTTVFGRRPVRDSLRQFGKLGSQSLHCGDAHCLQPENVVQQSLRPFRRCRVAASLLHLGHPLPLAMDTHVAERYVGFGYSEPFFKGCAEHFEHHVTGNGCSHFPGVAGLYLAVGDRLAAEVGDSAALTVVWLSFDDKGCSGTLRFLLCHQPQQDAALVFVGRRRQKITKFRYVCFTDKLLDDRGRIRFLLCQHLQQGAASVIVGRRRQKLTKFRYVCSMDKLLHGWAP